MDTYCVEYTGRIWVEAKDEDEAREKANRITDKCNDLDFDYPEVEVQ